MGKNVRAKMVCNHVTKHESTEVVKLTPVTSGTPEDNNFSKYTPSGSLELSITNESLFGHFQPGKKYYIDIAEAA